MQLSQYVSVSHTALKTPSPIQFGVKMTGWQRFVGGGDKYNAAVRRAHLQRLAEKNAAGYTTGPYPIGDDGKQLTRPFSSVSSDAYTSPDHLPGVDAFRSSSGKNGSTQAAFRVGDLIWTPSPDGKVLAAHYASDSQVARDAVADLSVVDIGRGVARGVHTVRKAVHNWFHSINKMD